MEKELDQFEFINSQTGNVIAYLTLPAGMDRIMRLLELDRKRTALAISNFLYIDLIYWQEHGHCVR